MQSPGSSRYLVLAGLGTWRIHEGVGIQQEKMNRLQPKAVGLADVVLAAVEDAWGKATAACARGHGDGGAGEVNAGVQHGQDG